MLKRFLPAVLLLTSCTVFAVEVPVAVVVAHATTQNVPIDIDALGSLTAPQFVTLSAETSGRVAHVYFKNGQPVVQGMPVIQLDNAKAEAGYQSAVAALNVARHTYQRSKLLLNQAVSEQSLEQAQAKFEADEAAVKTSLVTLNQKQVQAPFSGTLGKFQVAVGDYVTAGQPLVTLVNSSELRANYTVQQSKYSGLRLGQTVTVTVNAYPKHTFYGTVSYISPTVNATTRSFAVQALIQNSKHLLLPGMFVQVVQQIGEHKDAVVVPEMAVSADAKGEFVYKVQKSRAVKAYVKVGNHIDGKTEILSGLKKGTEVVVAGVQKLEDGSLLRIQLPKKTSKGK